MKPLFTLHAGEYLTGCEIERQLGAKVNLWVPSKDEGIDILITDRMNKRMTSIQVKYSRDFIRLVKDNARRKALRSGGWWTFNRLKLKNSKADFWVLLTYDGFGKESDFIVIPPKDLLRIYDRTGRKQRIIQSYVWVTKNRNLAIEGRDLTKEKSIDMIEGKISAGIRDLTPYLANWDQIRKKLGV
jgi:hypothetical protein